MKNTLENALALEKNLTVESSARLELGDCNSGRFGWQPPGRQFSVHGKERLRLMKQLKLLKGTQVTNYAVGGVCQPQKKGVSHRKCIKKVCREYQNINRPFISERSLAFFFNHL